jgi:1-deoxy-D-xylulose-5-phosphate reductoisomerase
VLNASNEIAVHAFLAGRIGFTAIAEVIDATLDELGSQPVRAFETLFDVDRRARDVARAEIAAAAAR